jgi:L-alanine-DL-glutamate epimerase-like enolase superfamily enzyme
MKITGKIMSRRTLLAKGLLLPSVLSTSTKTNAPKKKPTTVSKPFRPTDIRLLAVRYGFEEYKYRAPYQFGGRTVDRVTLLNVHVEARTSSGREASGFGSMPLGNAWSFPSQKVSYNRSLEAMKELASEIQQITAAYPQTAHPIDINWELEPFYLAAADGLSRRMKLAEPIPKLCTLVTASPFDAAIHDAYGKANGINCYLGYDAQHVNHDLSYYLGSAFRGEFLDQYLLKKPTASISLYHSIGASDPIFESDIKQRIGDGLPETLGEWIQADGVTHLKIKLNGGNLKADVDRVVKIERAAAEAQNHRRVGDWKYCCDFNEGCKDAGYLLSFLKEVKKKVPAILSRLQYIEQPTARDLKANPQNVMHEAARIVPVVIDESLVDLESFHLSRRLGYTGVALKVCKGQTNALLMAAAAQKFKSFLCVQDLTCPGASLIHSAGLAAHIPGVSTIEANSRQYVPSANEKWKKTFPLIFEVHTGELGTGDLTRPGLSAV